MPELPASSAKRPVTKCSWALPRPEIHTDDTSVIGGQSDFWRTARLATILDSKISHQVGLQRMNRMEAMVHESLHFGDGI